MAIASLAFSIFALLAAGASALYARKQARMTRLLAQDDAARRLEERTPTIGLEVESVNKGASHRLWLRLLDNGPLTDATVEILEPVHVRFKQGTAGVDRGSDMTYRVGHTGALLTGDDFAWRIEWSDKDETPTRMRLKITCRGSRPAEVWLMTRAVDVPQKFGASR